MKHLTAGVILVLLFAAGCTSPSPTSPASTASSPLVTTPPPAPPPPAPPPTPAPTPQPPGNPPAPPPRPTQYAASGSYRIIEYRQAPGALAMIVPTVGPVTVNLTIAPGGAVEGRIEILTSASWRGDVRGRVKEGSRVQVELIRNEGPAPEDLTIGLDVDTSTGQGELLFTLGGGSIACSVNLAVR